MSPTLALPAEAEVVGFWLDGKAKAYPVSALAKTGGILSDSVGAQDRPGR